jgi:hypothetical protein
MGFIALLIIVGIVAVVGTIILFVIRMNRGDEMVAGGSMGSQVGGHEDASWGPTSKPSGHAHDEPES